MTYADCFLECFTIVVNRPDGEFDLFGIRAVTLDDAIVTAFERYGDDVSCVFNDVETAIF